ncbi:hypothetical protein DPMN_139174 [Dreissena polymorpha]|uniref:Uncharacterized protein n=1 Tax=Dreissena polymorpha TaxID=45954 RepID=A0A9D4G8J9_DREPO|nr:hypothetical protein DPMN_139174 [Dreissena polymorpha]
MRNVGGFLWQQERALLILKCLVWTRTSKDSILSDKVCTSLVRSDSCFSKDILLWKNKI